MWLWFALLAACAACCVANKEIDTEMEWVYDIVPEALKWNMTHTGLKTHDVRPGSGPTFVDGDTLVVMYKLYIVPQNREKGKIKHYYSQSNPQTAYKLTLGPKDISVLAGFEEACRGMRVGGQRVALLHPGIAYGIGATEFGIPPHATLLYYLEVIGVTTAPPPADPSGTPVPTWDGRVFPPGMVPPPGAMGSVATPTPSPPPPSSHEGGEGEAAQGKGKGKGRKGAGKGKAKDTPSQSQVPVSVRSQDSAEL